VRAVWLGVNVQDVPPFRLLMPQKVPPK